METETLKPGFLSNIYVHKPLHRHILNIQSLIKLKEVSLILRFRIFPPTILINIVHNQDNSQTFYSTFFIRFGS